MTLRSIRERWELYSRLRWTSPHLQEIESAIQWSALLVAVMVAAMVIAR